MDRRRLLLVVAAVGAGAVLVVLGQRGSQEGAGFRGAPSRGAAPSQEGAPDQAGTPAGVPSAGAPATTIAPPPIEDGPATGTEALDPAERPAALRAAERFAARWSTPDPDWHDRVAELATPTLAAELAGADPPRPAPALTGPGQLYLDAPEWARIGVPAEGGTLVLDVIATGGPDGGGADGGWLVSAVDWWPA